jgi:hypothetical protein
MKYRVFGVVMLVVAMCGTAWGRTWYVDTDGTGDVPDIRTGIASASEGDTLLLADGVYTGDGNTNLSFGGKAIVIRSESGDPHACVIDCEGGGGRWARGFEFYRGEGPQSVLEAIMITHGYMYEGAGIWCWASSPTVRNVILTENRATYSSGGIYCGGGSQPAISNVTLIGNEAPEGGAVFCTESSSPVISNSIMAFNEQGGALRVGDGSSNPELVCCDIFGNVGGDWGASILSQYGMFGNISANPLFCLDRNAGRPYMLNASSPCVCACQPDCMHMGAAGIGCTDGIEATVDIDPDVINPRSRTRWLTCYIELAEGYDPDSIDVGTVMVNDVVPAETAPTEVADYDEDGIEDLMVKFAWIDVYASFAGYGEIEMRVSGYVGDVAFAGLDTVRVLYKEVKMPCGTDDKSAELMPDIEITGEAGGTEGVSIKLGLPEAANVKIAVYDVRGRLVRELVNEMKPADSYSIGWDYQDAQSSRVAPGMYFITVETGRHVETSKIVLIR